MAQVILWPGSNWLRECNALEGWTPFCLCMVPCPQDVLHFSCLVIKTVNAWCKRSSRLIMPTAAPTTALLDIKTETFTEANTSFMDSRGRSYHSVLWSQYLTSIRLQHPRQSSSCVSFCKFTSSWHCLQQHQDMRRLYEAIIQYRLNKLYCNIKVMAETHTAAIKVPDRPTATSALCQFRNLLSTTVNFQIFRCPQIF